MLGRPRSPAKKVKKTRPPVIMTTFTDEVVGLRGFVVADSLVNGQSMGGTRIWPSVSLEEVAALARKMTLKLSLAQLPIGGAKAGIVCDLPPGQKRDRVLRAFGRLAAPVLHGGIYLGSDMGCSYRDRDYFHEAANYTVQRRERRGVRAGHSIPCEWPEVWRRCRDVTGTGVADATTAIADTTGLGADDRTVSIQGFGVVGQGAAKRLVREGYRVTCVSDVHGAVYHPDGLDLEPLLAATNAQGEIERGKLPKSVRFASDPAACLGAEVGVLILAAGGDSIRADNAASVRAKIVVEGANLPTTEEAQKILFGRGIVDVPDILANVGGAMASALVLAGETPPELDTDAFVAWIFAEVRERIRDNAALVHSMSVSEERPMHDIAWRVARERAETRYNRPATVTTVPPPVGAARNS